MEAAHWGYLEGAKALVAMMANVNAKTNVGGGASGCLDDDDAADIPKV